MVIDILIGTIIQDEHNITHTNSFLEVLSPGSVSLNVNKVEYKLDFKQNVAFEIMASSFILKSL